MGIRRVVEQLESRLAPAGHGAATGKAEWKRYGDGTTSFDLKVRDLAAPDRTVVEVRIGDLVVAMVPVERGRVAVDVEALPVEPRAGDVVAIVGAATLASGALVLD